MYPTLAINHTLNTDHYMQWLCSMYRIVMVSLLLNTSALDLDNNLLHGNQLAYHCFCCKNVEIAISFRFNGHFPGGPGLDSTSMSMVCW